ncbi:reverse transcriptase [Morganella morganii]|uniref:reverse transcriptase domain-containing protein n=1 Tax=Morganella morganii TaxID=582 RepID=UPI000E240789|nr:reverse transcriptase domain-containing protein [Morganella morganii]REL18771.1 reverse transcriptase [Morganella morganii]HDU8493842.1 reverse transcriptase [Morganella morganii]
MTTYQNRWLHKFELKKNNWVYVPSSEARDQGSAFLKDLLLKWTPPIYYYHLRNGGHISALQVHLNSKYFAHIDLKHFFNSTGRSRVTRVLREFYPFEQAREIARFSTVKNLVSLCPSHVIPYGFVQSPMIATICLDKSLLGKTIRELFNRKDIKISVYMDDIIISSLSLDIVESVYSQLLRCIKKSHYLINEDKSQPPAKNIVVFNINLSRNNIKITETRVIELLINYITTKSVHVKEGIKSYVKKINIDQVDIFK